MPIRLDHIIIKMIPLMTFSPKISSHAVPYTLSIFSGLFCHKEYNTLSFDRVYKKNLKLTEDKS